MSQGPGAPGCAAAAVLFAWLGFWCLIVLVPVGTTARLRARRLERDDFSLNRHPALPYWWSMIFSDLPSPAEA
jgi:hypothetical protein